MLPEGAEHAPLVLIVDDDPNARDLLATTVRREGYRVIEATDGETALALARQWHPDIITLDVLMPSLQPVPNNELIGVQSVRQGRSDVGRDAGAIEALDTRDSALLAPAIGVKADDDGRDAMMRERPYLFTRKLRGYARDDARIPKGLRNRRIIHTLDQNEILVPGASCPVEV